MSKVFINTEGLEQELSIFENSLTNIKNIFQNERNNLNYMNDGHSWVGKSQQTMYNKQIEFQQNFDPIEEALQVYIDFIRKSLEDYNREESTRVKNIEENLDNLNVN